MTRTRFPWHRVFHPLCGADPATLAALVVRRGPPSLAGAPAFAVAAASALVRSPFTALELLLDLLPRAAVAPPIFIVGHPRSGTTHLHNVLAASGAFSTVPPVLAAMPWERRTLGPLLRPFINPYLPETRLIDGVALGPDAPTEDEIGLANLGPDSYFHAIYFPRAFAEDYWNGLIGDGARVAARAAAIRRYVTRMARPRAPPLLLKNPAYTAQVATLMRLFPGARVVHIRRDPEAVFASTRRALRHALAELSLQDWAHVDIDAIVLDTYPAMMRALREQSAGLAPARFAELSFEDLIAAPQTVLAGLWRRLDLPDEPRAMRGIAAYLASVRDYRAMPARLTAAERALLRVRWPEETARFGRDTPASPPPMRAVSSR